MSLNLYGKAIVDKDDMNYILNQRFDGFELALRKKDLENNNYKETVEILKEYKEHIKTIHLPHCQLEEFPEVIEKIKQLYKDVFENSYKEEEKPCLVIHSNRILSYLDLKEFYNVLQELEKQNILFTIENQPGDSADFFKAYITNNNLNICLDTAHLWISYPEKEKYLEELESLLKTGKVKAIHLNDVKEEQINNYKIPIDNQPIQEEQKTIPWEETMKLIQKYCKDKDIPIIIEVPKEKQKESKEVIEKILNRIN